MAQTIEPATRPQLGLPRSVQTLEAVRSVTGGGFDPDAWHVMDQRDNALIADEILHGAGSSTFVYSFSINGVDVSGVSVIGARHLAAHYKGLRHRLVGSMQKTGGLCMFQSFPAENMPMAVSASVINELADQPDFYSAVVELTDVKTGNSIQIERREARFERRRDGSEYERPNYQTIAQSKAYRNAVLSLIPQDVIIQWKQQMLKLNKSATITESVIDQKRANVLRFAAQKGLALERRAIDHLTLDQISGLGDAAREGELPAFVHAAESLGLIEQNMPQSEPGRDVASTASDAPASNPARRRGRPPGPRQQREPEPTSDAAGEEQPADEPAAQPQPQQEQRPQIDFEV